MDQNATKCENLYCKGILFDLIDSEFSNECGVCYESLEDQEMVVLSDCDHAFCNSCLQDFRGDNWLFNCPYCRQTSYNILKTTNYIKGDQRMKMFKEHLKCFENDPIVMALFQELSPLWREFIEKLLRAEARDMYPNIEEGEDIHGLIKINEVNRYVTYLSKDEKFMRLNIICMLPGITIQFMLSNEDLSYDEVDNEHADQLISWLNRHYDKSWSIAQNFMDHYEVDYSLWRQFPKIHCAMSSDRYVGFPEYDKSKVVVEDNVNLFLEHNFKDLKFENKIQEFYYLTEVMSYFIPFRDTEQYLEFR